MAKKRVSKRVSEHVQELITELEAVTGDQTFKNTKSVREGEGIIIPVGMSCKEAWYSLFVAARKEELQEIRKRRKRARLELRKPLRCLRSFLIKQLSK